MSLRLDGFTPAFPISPLVVVGVCASGKTTLANHLRLRGIAAHAVAQEHSQVKDLFRRSGPWVVLLVSSWGTVHRRRQLAWNPKFYREEWDRLSAARQGASLVVHTDYLTPDAVADRVAEWFDRWFGFEAFWNQHPEWGRPERQEVRAHYLP